MKISKRTFICFLSIAVGFIAGCSSAYKKRQEEFPTPEENSAQIKKVFDKNKGALENCFKTNKWTAPKKTAKGSLQVFVADEGRLTSVAVLNKNWNNPKIDACLKDAVKLWKFENIRIPRDLEAGQTFPLEYK